jgi:hypothetical protein
MLFSHREKLYREPPALKQLLLVGTKPAPNQCQTVRGGCGREKKEGEKRGKEGKDPGKTFLAPKRYLPNGTRL